jgi:hypothetical protein
MITGVHAVVFSEDANATRAFLRVHSVSPSSMQAPAG